MACYQEPVRVQHVHFFRSLSRVQIETFETIFKWSQLATKPGLNLENRLHQNWRSSVDFCLPFPVSLWCVVDFWWLVPSRWLFSWTGQSGEQVAGFGLLTAFGSPSALLWPVHQRKRERGTSWHLLCMHLVRNCRLLSEMLNLKDEAYWFQ